MIENNALLNNDYFDDLQIKDFLFKIDTVEEGSAILYDYYNMSIIYVFEQIGAAVDVMKLIYEREYELFPTIAVRYKKQSYYIDHKTREIIIT